MFVEAEFTDGKRNVIRVPRFGLDQRFQGTSDDDGHKCADRLYAALEQDALGAAEGSAERFVELFCDSENERGVRFWGSQGFFHREGDSSKTRQREYLRFTRRPPDTEGDRSAPIDPD